MPQSPSAPLPVNVTMIARSNCPTCHDLLDELASLRNMSYIQLNVVNVDLEKLPSYAQGTIVPATYIGEKLWRFGKYPREALEERLRREVPIPQYHRLNS